ncbi:hypothetical protein TeGR_g7285 [Tetraparma gracilis]|uniref:GST N-terminal domain-containing protein n=1 Tax=Tetraparma gracilis TaxID=2962635 RepID=A0ABQ6M7B7_9STRA|nr:hypothetical protein TeGR_g7285 [Tetraparma gracilis]
MLLLLPLLLLLPPSLPFSLLPSPRPLPPFIHPFIHPRAGNPSPRPSLALPSSNPSNPYPNALARGLSVTPTRAAPLPADPFTLYLPPSFSDPSLPGACPAAHYVRSVLHSKSLPHSLRPTPPGGAPGWLEEHYGGALPALRHGSEAYTDAETIALYLDFFFVGEGHGPSLAGEGVVPEQVAEAANGVFPAFERLVVAGESPEALADVASHLDALAGHLSSSPYLRGAAPTLADYELAPQLHAAAVLRPTLLPGAVGEYLGRMREDGSFMAGMDYRDGDVREGWERKRRAAQK